MTEKITRAKTWRAPLLNPPRIKQSGIRERMLPDVKFLDKVGRKRAMLFPN